eukprot:TRINITY_DN18523_c0_g1_i1.p1 TRINITY_DN18523_c0_g1~~TRINITY_DN18523_c0_g1_i1.p1  ORF type:complete len:853 (+),score=152.88 TRINITY_DN18523_c0_g1_i1:84-2561(+)
MPPGPGAADPQQQTAPPDSERSQPASRPSAPGSPGQAPRQHHPGGGEEGSVGASHRTPRQTPLGTAAGTPAGTVKTTPVTTPAQAPAALPPASGQAPAAARRNRSMRHAPGGHVAQGRETGARLTQLEGHIRTRLEKVSELCERMRKAEATKQQFVKLRQLLEDRLKGDEHGRGAVGADRAQAAAAETATAPPPRRILQPALVDRAQAPWARSLPRPFYMPPVLPPLDGTAPAVPAGNPGDSVVWDDPVTRTHWQIHFAEGNLYLQADGRPPSPADRGVWHPCPISELRWYRDTGLLTDQDGNGGRAPPELVDAPAGAELPAPLHFLAAKAGVPVRVVASGMVQQALPPAVKGPAASEEREVGDATTLCLLFQAFQPFLDSNSSDAAAVETELGPIKNPSDVAEAYRPFIPPCTMDYSSSSPSEQTLPEDNPFGKEYGVQWNRAQLLGRRGELIAQQQSRPEPDPEGGVPGSKMVRRGRHGTVGPVAFLRVLQFLTEGTADNLLLRSLFDYFARNYQRGAGQTDVQCVHLGEFLNSIDDVLQLPEVRRDYLKRCFMLASADGCTVSRAGLLGTVITEGKLTMHQAYTVVEHLPQRPPTPPPPPPEPKQRKRAKAGARREDDDEEGVGRVSSLAVMRRWQLGPCVNEAQFYRIVAESPYLFNVFLNVALRCVANYYAERLQAKEDPNRAGLELEVEPCGVGVFALASSSFDSFTQSPRGRGAAGTQLDRSTAGVLEQSALAGGTAAPAQQPREANAPAAAPGPDAPPRHRRVSLPDLLSPQHWAPRGMPDWLQRDLPPAPRAPAPLLLQIVGPVWTAAGDGCGRPA